MATSNYTAALLAISFISFVTCVSTKTIHIVTDSTSCQDTATDSDVRCATLSQFALNSSSFTTSNITTITLIMDPGIHIFNSTLFFSNVSMAELLSPPEDTMSIACNTTSSAFVFEDISSVRIVGMILRGCGEIIVSNVEEFIVQDCDFFAEEFEGAGLIVSETNGHIMNSEFSMYSSGALRVVDDSELIVSGCTFSQNQADVSAELVNSTLGSIDITQPRTEYEPSVYNLIMLLNQSSHLTGGAISLHNSTMLISNTTLEDNAALLGGALYAENSSLTISNGSSLIGNLAFSGGALFAVGSSVMITDGRYMDNAANGSGGALYVGLLTVCHIESADFERNTASYGGALYVYSFADVMVSLYTNYYYYSGGAGVTLTAYNSVTVDNCTLLNNTAGYGGALYTEQSNLIISNSTINYNTATLRGSALYSRPFSNIIINGSSLKKNTGILGVLYFNRTSLQFINSEMSGNTYAYGYALESEIELLGENIIYDNCGSFVVILSNMTIRGQTLFVNNNMPNECRETDIEIETVNITSGAVTSFISNVYVFGKVNFSSNSAIYGGAILSWESRLHIWRGEIIFQDNYASGEGGAIYVYESNVEFRLARCLFDGNFAEESGGAINLVSSTVNIFRGSTVEFTENEAKLGGAIFFELGSKLSIDKTNAHDSIDVSFSQNSADYGGALYVTDDTNSGTCAASSQSLALARSFSNFVAASECFFQTLALYSLSSVSNPLTKHIHFSNNLANHTGNSLYGGLLDRCQPSIFSEFSILHLNKEVSGTKYILETTDIQGEDISSGPVRLCFCENGTPNCNYVPTDPWLVTKGNLSILPIVAVDQFNHTVETEIISFFSSRSAESRLSSHNIQMTYGNCSDLQFKIQSAAKTENLTLFANGSCGSIGISATMIDIEFLNCDCPVGFKDAENDSEVCRCDCTKELIEKLGGEDQCPQNHQNNFLQRDSNFWIGTLNDSAPYHNKCLAFFRYCPFDYCLRPDQSMPIRFYLNTSQITNSDMQCKGDRTGALCGSCRDGFSLALGSSKCLPNSACTNSYIALVLAFALAGVVLVAFIMFCNLTVAVGTMNGLIFYANIIITTRINNNFSQSNSGIFVNPLAIFIAWLNLDLGIETCFHQGMDGLTKVGWQFVFPLYVLLLVVLVIFLCECSQRFANFLSGRNAVATLATLILFSYLKFLRIIIDAFTPAIIHFICQDEDRLVQYTERRWYYDGNKYFNPRHIVMFLAALVILIIGVAYTLILLTGQWFGKLSECPGLKWLCGQKLNHFLEPYSAPYIPKYRYWTGLLLLARILSCIISTIATDRGVPQGNFFSITMIATALLLWKLVVGGRIYQHLLVDVLESLFFVLLIIYSSAAQFILSYTDVLEPIFLFNVLAAFAFLVFILILLYHGYIYVLLPTSAGERFNMWITEKLNDGKHWLKETSCWKRFRSVKPETAEFEEDDSPFSRGQHSFYSLQASYSLEPNLKKRLQLKKGSQPKKKQQSVTYSTVEIVPETPLSEELGHYSKRMATLRNSNHKKEHCSSQEEFELVPVLSEESNNDEDESCENDNSASADLECSTEQGCSYTKAVEDKICDGPTSQTKSAEVEMDGEGVKLTVEENGTPAELVQEGCDEFSTSYELIAN